MYQTLLFCQKGELHSYLEEMKKKIRTEIESCDRNYILKVNESAYYEYLLSKYNLDPPELLDDQAKAYEPTDTECVNPLRAFFPDIGSTYVKGTRVRISIPFKGDGNLFHFTPSTFTSPPSGEIHGQEIQLIFDYAQPEDEKIKKEYLSILAQIKQYLVWVRNDVKNYNDQIKTLTMDLLSQRKKRILSDLHLVESIGVPLKHRDSVSSTYTVPTIRERITIQFPKVSKEKFRPEPAITNAEYENILEKLSNMSIAMERSPKTFIKLEEEEIRDFFLIILNAHYEGRASGETFNFGGKNDILIREENRNVFIAECKFWRGKQEFREAIDQLLGYLSWRDTKTAMLVFNRNKDSSAVLQKIDSAAKSHNNYLRTFKLNSEKLHEPSVLPFIFSQPNDLNKELFLAILVFDIPT